MYKKNKLKQHLLLLIHNFFTIVKSKRENMATIMMAASVARGMKKKASARRVTASNTVAAGEFNKLLKIKKI